MDLFLFTNNVIKIAEEESEEEEGVGYKERLKRALPFVLGAGVGSVGVSVLSQQIKKVKDPRIIKGLKYGIPAATAISAQLLIPKIKKQIENDIIKGKKYKKD